MSLLRRLPRSAQLALLLLMLLALAAMLVPLLSPYACDQIDFGGVWSAPPGLQAAHWLGTDSLGRDLLVRGFCGARVSLLVGLVGTLVALLIGVSYGALAGYFAGRLDALMMRVVDVLYALPFMFLVIVLMALFGRHFLLLFVALGAVLWLDMARLVRGQTLALREREFVAAARLAGLSELQILRRHILPNLAGVVIVYATLTVPQVILVESFISFLGLGVQEPLTSWGVLINDGAREMQSSIWPLLIPCLLLLLTLLCLNLIGEALRAALEPQVRR
ncbi:oligopeptide transport system permease protein [Solimonas aquatica]|uniref:Oligopeptide transport system permease protein n=1 Tax=Solimonas aquatica TaxID=489703 RepID=A0A1H9L8D2_9GAMM|nr:ABC transporter permease subunit [Solimonas aquatica]SER07427.1 oligopeptide transport system permease protein [Solimonas aquatica]